MSHVEVVESSTTDFVGQHVGQTGPKTIKQLERGLGKVLFVDEAYRLGEGMFAQEAVNELVDTMTKPKFAGKLVIILAGYDNDMNNLLSVNEGLSSRFADEIIFPSLNPEHCLKLLASKLKQSMIIVPALESPFAYPNFRDRIAELSGLPRWGNARDVQTLAKSMVRAVYESNTTKTEQLVLSEEKAMACIKTMLAARRARNQALPSSRPLFPAQAQSLNAFQSRSPTCFNTSIATQDSPETSKEEAEWEKSTSPESTGEERDAGVSDAVWSQLQNDKKAAELQAQRLEKMIRDKEDAIRVSEETERQLAAEAAALREIQAKNEAEALELLRQSEEARIKELEAKAERERIQKELERQRKAELERKRLEAQAQSKLRQMGVCCQGFQWVKQSGGYRCAGGSHWVSDGQLGI